MLVAFLSRVRAPPFDVTDMLERRKEGRGRGKEGCSGRRGEERGMTENHLLLLCSFTLARRVESEPSRELTTGRCDVRVLPRAPATRIPAWQRAPLQSSVLRSRIGNELPRIGTRHERSSEFGAERAHPRDKSSGLRAFSSLFVLSRASSSPHRTPHRHSSFPPALCIPLLSCHSAIASSILPPPRSRCKLVSGSPLCCTSRQITALTSALPPPRLPRPPPAL